MIKYKNYALSPVQGMRTFFYIKKNIKTGELVELEDSTFYTTFLERICKWNYIESNSENPQYVFYPVYE